jgi:lon-related putative ATP-dependent protease
MLPMNDTKPASPELRPEELRWRCDPDRFHFETTLELAGSPIQIIGQDRAREALRLGLNVRAEGYNIFATGEVGGGRSTTVRRMLGETDLGEVPPDDLVFVHDFEQTDQPHLLKFVAGRGREFRTAMEELIEGLLRDLPRIYSSDLYQRQRTAIIDTASQDQKKAFRDFEQRLEGEGFTMVQVQIGPLTRPNIVPVHEGKPIDIDEIAQLVEQGKYVKEEFDAIQRRLSELRGELEVLGKTVRRMDRDLRRHLAEMDREFASPVLEEAVGDLRDAFPEAGVEAYLKQVSEALLDSLDDLRHGAEEQQDPHPEGEAEVEVDTRFDVNLVVDNSSTKGRPVIWETAPNYRNLFGAIEKVRTSGGEWITDHTRIRAGSLLRANGGFLVLDALDVLVEPAVWAALKRTLRTCQVEVQAFDPMNVMGGNALKPEPVPIDVKVIMIGTRQIYRLLHAHDEDFSKIFKVKAEMAMTIPRSDQELDNYAAFVHKKTQDDDLPPFNREAVAAVVEHGARLTEHRGKLTTRFAEIADLARESAFWARQRAHDVVEGADVDQALDRKIHRVNLIEEVLRERIEDGMVLIEIDGEVIGQVNGLAILDTGDHAFCQPSRITATVAMGRAGVIDLDREAQMSGSLHTKGVLILTGFLRERFAQNKPLALTATVCFEQNYGGVDGDSASSTELYALLSNLADVPIKQGIAVTGSVNQRGEVQPIGGANEKIEGFYDVCRVLGMTGDQGVMIPRRNMPNLMLRKDIVEAVARGEFHVWAVATIEEGLEVLTGVPAGKADENGAYAEGTIFAKADATLTRLAEQVNAFGPADQRGQV